MIGLGVWCQHGGVLTAGVGIMCQLTQVFRIQVRELSARAPSKRLPHFAPTLACSQS